MQIGIVGLPFSGKTTLFQTITKTLLDTSHLSKPEAHLAVIKVPDSRLDKLTEIFNPKKKINATIEFIDVAGLQSDETGSVKFTGNFLANVKNNDALILVVRLFKDEAITHPLGKIDMMRDINLFETEFILSDLSIVEKRIENLKKQSAKGGLKTQDDKMKREIALLEKCNNHLQNEQPLRNLELTKDDQVILKTYQLLSEKPLLIALNMDESQVQDKDKYLDTLVKTKIGKRSKALAFFGKIEFEMCELSEEDAELFMSEYVITESALTGIIRVAYSLLGLQSFFTVGEDECRAWTIKKGMNAQESAGEIHTDFFDRFIRAEVVHFNDFIKSGSFAKAKELGLWRLEGKEYIVNDGDIISVRHS